MGMKNKKAKISLYFSLSPSDITLDESVGWNVMLKHQEFRDMFNCSNNFL